MKALTLTQPWATLSALGEKKIETRSWSTNYRGPIAIHSAKTYGKGGKKDILDMFDQIDTFPLVLKKHALTLDDLPLGCVVAVCNLVGVISTQAMRSKESHEWIGPDDRVYRFYLTNHEFDFGDYTPGRWAWLLSDVRMFTEPIPARGALGLWEWIEK